MAKSKTAASVPDGDIPDFMRGDEPVAVATSPGADTGPIDFGPYALPVDGESLSWAKIEKLLLKLWDGTANSAELEFLAVSGWIDRERNLEHKRRLFVIRNCLKTCPSLEAFEQAKVDRDNVIATAEKTRERLKPERDELLARLAEIDAETEQCEQTLSRASDLVNRMQEAISELRHPERLPMHINIRIGQLREKINDGPVEGGDTQQRGATLRGEIDNLRNYYFNPELQPV